MDPVTGFQNVYATGINKDLIEFTRLADGRWITDDLTMATGGATIMGSPQPFVDPLTGFQNVYATTTTGHVVEFTRFPDGHWLVFDITATTGENPGTGDPQPFVDPLTVFQNVYTIAGAGHLIEFTRLPTGAWISLDLTTRFGGPSFASLTRDSRPVIDPLTLFQNVYATTNGGHLVGYTRLPPGNWIGRRRRCSRPSRCPRR